MLLKDVYFAARRMWKWSRIRAGALCAILLTVEGTFLVGNSAKVMQGGWLPLAIGGAVFLQMTTWKKGGLLLLRTEAVHGRHLSQSAKMGHPRLAGALRILWATPRVGRRRSPASMMLTRGLGLRY
jgi:K+ transporter